MKRCVFLRDEWKRFKRCHWGFLKEDIYIKITRERERESVCIYMCTYIMKRKEK